jgi:hypothetical protein
MTGRGPLLINTLALWSGLQPGHVALLLGMLLLGGLLLMGRRR